MESIKDIRIDNWYKTISEAIGRAKIRNEKSYVLSDRIFCKIPKEVFDKFRNAGYTIEEYKISWS